MTIEWNGKVVRTVGDLVSALHQLKSREEGRAFVEACRAEMKENTEANLGYCVGYIGGSDPESVAIRNQIHGFIAIEHPVFGGGGY